MAKPKNTLIGHTRGSIGGVTFTVWKGINVMKEKVSTVGGANSPAQLLQQARLKLMVSIYRLISTSVQIGFSTQAIKKSEYNAFMAANLNAATSGTTAANVSFVPSLATMSKGTIGPIIQTSASETDTNTMTIVFPTTVPIGGAADDLAIAVVYNETQNNWGSNVVGVERNTGTIDVINPDGITAGNVINVYLYFKSATSNDVSDSDYATYTI